MKVRPATHFSGDAIPYLQPGRLGVFGTDVWDCNNGNAMMFVVVREEGYEFILVRRLGAQKSLVEAHHAGERLGPRPKDNMGELDG